VRVGDLVKFRLCAQQGQIGMISGVPKHDSIYPPGCWLYWVAFAGGVQCFTGNQLVMIDESR